MSDGWVRRAEAAAGRGSAEDEDERVLVGRPPPVLDAEGVKAVLAPLLAALVWAGAVFREMVAGSSLDPIAFLLRLLALGLTLRVLLLGAELWDRLQVLLGARRHVLVLLPEGLLYRSPAMDVVVAREDVVGIVERGRWQKRPPGRRFSEVYVVTDPAQGRTHVALPPVFDDTPGQLAERLMRWRGAAPEPSEADRGRLAPSAAALWDQAAAGRAPEGTTVIRHGWQWIKKGPYAAVLVGIAAVEGILRAGPSVWEAIDPLIGGGLILVLLAIPARWFWMTRREVRPRKGVSLVLTPAECLIRTRAGMLRVRWENVARADADAKRKWSVLEGAHLARQLVLIRQQAPAIRYDEPYLGLPVEVAQILVDAYRRGALPRAASS